MALIREFSNGLAHLLYPHLCEGCHLPLLIQEDTLCLTCMQQLSRTGFYMLPDNEAALRFAGRIPYQHVTALSHFAPDSLFGLLVHRLKYERKKTIGTFLGRQLGYELLKSSWMQSVDVLIPVPLHPKKEASRSYNQSRIIAEGISEVTGKATNTSSLQRIRHTETQTQKSRAERVANMKDAFSLHKSQALQGLHVLLIDDVLTTGATLEAAAHALYQIPMIKISIATAGLAAG
jgi:ComF family protein